MKRFLFLTILLATLSVEAQQFSFSTSTAQAKGFSFNREKSMFTEYDYYNGSDLYLTQCRQMSVLDKVGLSQPKYTVVHYNSQFEPVSSLDLDYPRKKSHVCTLLGNDTLTTVAVELTDENMAVEYTRYDANKLTQIGNEETLYEMTTMKHYDGSFYLYSSKSGRYHALTLEATGRSDSYMGHVLLFDNSMNLKLNKELSGMSKVLQLLVTDEGKVVTLGISSSDEIELHCFDGSQELKHSYSMTGSVLTNIYLCGYVGSKALIMAIADKGTKVFSMACDMVSGDVHISVKNIDQAAFQPIYNNYNKHLASRRSLQIPYSAEVFDADFNDQGASMIISFGEQWRSNNDNESWYQLGGILMAHVDANGEIQYVKGFPRQTKVFNEGAFLDMLEASHVVCQGEKTYVVYPERKKFTKPNFKYKKMSYCTLQKDATAAAVFSVDRSGVVDNYSLMLPKKFKMFGDMYQSVDGSYYQLLMSTGRLQVARWTF